MSNMSYCRFYNTVGDLQDAVQHMNCNLSKEENKKRIQLIELCKSVAKKYKDSDFTDGYTSEDGDECSID